MLLTSTIHCPHCSGAREEVMASDACRVVYPCTHCAAILKPKAGDCCVFCSYGTVPCPPVQEEKK